MAKKGEAPTLFVLMEPDNRGWLYPLNARPVTGEAEAQREAEAHRTWGTRVVVVPYQPMPHAQFPTVPPEPKETRVLRELVEELPL